MEHYNFFLFSQLWLEVNGPSEEPYDELFGEILRDFHEFADSEWNDEGKPLYECIVAYLEKPADTGRYIAKSPGSLHHLYFESKAGLLAHLKQRSRELYLGAVPDSDLYEFFGARNYFRAV